MAGCSRWLLLLVVVLLAGTVRPVAGAERPDRHVVLISIDGFPADYLHDPSAPVTNIRRMAAQGTSAKGMTVSNPSVTWPNHTSLLTGVRPDTHGVMFNGVLEWSPGLPVKVNPRKDRADMVYAPAIDEVLHRAGQTVASINWPCTRNAKSIDFDFPDVPDTFEHTTPAFLEELKAAGVLSDERIEGFMKLSVAARDTTWTNAAIHAIKTHQPNLVMLHLLNVDAVHHKYGPGSWAGHSALGFADACVGRVVEAVREAGMLERTTFLIVADHGFMTIPKTLQPNVLLREAGLLTVEGGKAVTARAHVYPEGGVGMLYLTVPEKADEDRKQVLELFRGKEGIAEVLTPARFAELGLPLPTENRHMADLILVGKDGYGFSGSVSGDEFVVKSTSTLGTHGFLSTNPKMNAVFVASGAGIHQRDEVGVIENIDVAPTIARLLGVKLDSAKGRVLEDILAGDGR